MLTPKWDRLRDAINSCNGYRVLDDDDVIQAGDETVCASTLWSGNEEWGSIGEDDGETFIGRTVRDMNDAGHNNEMDVEERLFRRKLAPEGER